MPKCNTNTTIISGKYSYRYMLYIQLINFVVILFISLNLFYVLKYGYLEDINIFCDYFITYCSVISLNICRYCSTSHMNDIFFVLLWIRQIDILSSKLRLNVRDYWVHIRLHSRNSNHPKCLSWFRLVGDVFLIRSNFHELNIL